MDIFTQRLISLGHKITSELRSLRVSVEEQTDSIDRYREAQEKRSQTPPVIRAQFEVPPAEERKKEGQGTEKKWLERGKVILEALTLFAAIVYGWVAYHQWKDANHNFVVNQRAWIGISRPVSITAINYGPTKDTATYVVTLKNYGQSVALHTYTATKIVTDITQIRPQIEASCKEAVFGMNTPMQVKIVTADHKEITDRGGAAGESYFPSDEAGKWYHDASFDRAEVVFIVGCVAYRDEFGKERHTRFCNWATLDAKSTAVPIMLYSFIGYSGAD